MKLHATQEEHSPHQQTEPCCINAFGPDEFQTERRAWKFTQTFGAVDIDVWSSLQQIAAWANRRKLFCIKLRQSEYPLA